MAATLSSSGITTSSGGRINRTTAGGTGSYVTVYIAISTTLDGTTAGSDMNYTRPGVGNFNSGFTGTWRFMGGHTSATGGYQLWTRIS